MIENLYYDVETRSFADLDTVGTMAYAAHPSTQINSLVYAIDNQPPVLVDYYQCLKPNSGLNGFTLAFTTAKRVVAHKASFDANVVERVLKLKRSPANHKCTMAKAAYYGLPRKLDGMAQALGTSKLKDIGAGAQAMKLLRGGLYSPEDKPEAFQTLYRYNIGDVEVMRECDQMLPDLPPEIQQRWEVDFEINRRGIPIDMQQVENAIAMRGYLQEMNDQRMIDLTDGKVRTVNQTDKILDWLRWYQFVDLVDCTADTVQKALNGYLPDRARKVLELRQEAGLSSLSKYQAIKDHAVDGRLHEMAIWYGAHTGRPTGTGPQALNFPRSEEADKWADLISSTPQMLYLISKPAEKLKEGLRGAICTDENKVIVTRDASQAEARATGWLAGAKDFLDLFLTTDPYCTYGRKLFGREITKKNDPKERQASKASLLAFGFAGGIGAGQRVGDNYHIEFGVLAQLLLPTATYSEVAHAEQRWKWYIEKQPVKPLPHDHAIAVDVLKQRYRRDFPRIVEYWKELENAFLEGGQAGRIYIDKKPSGLRVLYLPSGRALHYHDVHIHSDGKYSYRDKFNRRKFIWKGTIIENCAQAVSQDICDWYKVQANKYIAPVIHHCYDEFSMEVEVSQLDRVNQQLKELEATRPDWTDGLPLGFDQVVGRRYGK